MAAEPMIESLNFKHLAHSGQPGRNGVFTQLFGERAQGVRACDYQAGAIIEIPPIKIS